jgi:hypothetical protein
MLGHDHTVSAHEVVRYLPVLRRNPFEFKNGSEGILCEKESKMKAHRYEWMLKCKP